MLISFVITIHPALQAWCSTGPPAADGVGDDGRDERKEEEGVAQAEQQQQWRQQQDGDARALRTAGRVFGEQRGQGQGQGQMIECAVAGTATTAAAPASS